MLFSIDSWRPERARVFLRRAAASRFWSPPTLRPSPLRAPPHPVQPRPILRFGQTTLYSRFPRDDNSVDDGVDADDEDQRSGLYTPLTGKACLPSMKEPPARKPLPFSALLLAYTGTLLWATLHMCVSTMQRLSYPFHRSRETSSGWKEYYGLFWRPEGGWGRERVYRLGGNFVCGFSGLFPGLIKGCGRKCRVLLDFSVAFVWSNFMRCKWFPMLR